MAFPRLMPFPDDELVQLLEAAYGPLGSHWQPHNAGGGGCRFRDLYPAGDCPWCAAEARRDTDASGGRRHDQPGRGP